MKINESAKPLGFTDENKLLLYKDVCAGREPNPPQSLEELLAQLKADDLEIERSLNKEEYELFINNNGLRELFEKVRNLPLVDRLTQIYLFNFNGYSIAKNFEKVFEIKKREAAELFDGEKTSEFYRKAFIIRDIKSEYEMAMSYILKRALQLDIEDRYKLYDFISEIEGYKGKFGDGRKK